MYFLDEGREGRGGKEREGISSRGRKEYEDREDQACLGNCQEFSKVGMQNIYKKEEGNEARRISRGFDFLWSHTQTRAVSALLHAGNHGDDSSDDDNRLDLHNT